MRLANLDGRAVLVSARGAALDVATASRGRFGPTLPGIFDDWDEFALWARDQDLSSANTPVDRLRLGSPSPSPRQVFAIGLNYRDHADEAGIAAPDGLPPVFTKFATCITGPDTLVPLPSGGHTDWEVELVVIIGRRAENVMEDEAWGHVAGLSVGQDLSERISQLAGPAPQFSFGKSFPGFGPVGPWLVTPDELADPDDLELGCSIDGEIVQTGRTGSLIYPVAKLISALSRGPVLLPGDIIFTGTPAGVGLGRDPQRWLRPGEVLRSWVEGIGELEQTFEPAKQ
jgi:2-keto-4-pentenoate hydratase/2-oxohepta-3-ene-1,7-dioic acid hydratase in catechol pathway